MTYQINILEWFDARELDYVPDHFIVVKTPITLESRCWISEKLSGRYALTVKDTDDNLDLQGVSYPAFEDQKDAVLYQLTWS